MNVWFFFLFLCLIYSNNGIAAPPDEHQAFRRIQAHLIIHDFSQAREEAKKALQFHPSSPLLYEIYLRTLAQLGEEKEMLRVWDQYQALFSDRALPRDVVEEMAWGVLNKASRSKALIMRQLALLAAFFSQETKGVAILYQGMQDPNYAIRAIAVKLASQYRDAKLLQAVRRLFYEEKIWVVRKEVLKAIGKMKIYDLRSELEELIASDNYALGEKSLAIGALLELVDEIGREEIVRLASSPHSGLRLLACETIAFFESHRDIDLLLRLARDEQADVRADALQAIGLLHPQEPLSSILQLAQEGLSSGHPLVKMSAAWLLMLYQPEEGRSVLERWLRHDRPDIRLLAAAAVTAAGRHGVPLATRFLRSHPDPMVRLNLALGLIGQRYAVPQAAEVIQQTLNSEKNNWAWSEQGLFRAIIPSYLSKESDPLSSPETDNQLVRLELLNILAFLKVPHVQETIRQFLLEKNWGVSAAASALLLTEGDEEAIELVENLLQDNQPKVRLQAALILSLWSREDKVVELLEQCYPQCDKELKSHILEGLGRIRSMRSIPFLIQVLKEPSQTLRIIAAMAIIQCLNH